ncbi:MAG: alkaline phosphatase family protein, partial [bacterium]
GQYRTVPFRTTIAHCPGVLLASAVILVAMLAFSWPGALLAAETPAPVRHVVLLSLDGARADALRSAMPTSLLIRASVSWTAQTISPSLTLPAHASMLSGVAPWKHRVTFNDWREGDPEFAPRTLFTEVRRLNGRTAAIVHKSKLRMLAPRAVVDWVQTLAYPRFRQADVVESAARYFLEQRPRLLVVHVADPDDAGHRYGWMTPEYLRVIADVPALIERLLHAFEDSGVGSQSLLMVTADHGGHGRTHGTNRAEDMTIPWLVFGARAQAGRIVSRQVVTYDTASTILDALGLPVPIDWHGRIVRDALRYRPP